MSPSAFFITHPRFSGVIAVVMVLLGLIAALVLPVSRILRLHRLLSVLFIQEQVHRLWQI